MAASVSSYCSSLGISHSNGRGNKALICQNSYRSVKLDIFKSSLFSNRYENSNCWEKIKFFNLTIDPWHQLQKGCVS